MSDLSRRALRAFVVSEAAFAALIFVPAGSLRFWQGWIFWAVFSLCTAWITVWLVVRDPELAERRMRGGVRAEREPSQKRILRAARIVLIVYALTPGLEWRFTHARIDWFAVLIGNALVIAGFVGCLAVLRENRFASSIVEVTQGQKVIDTGPYRRVRHPMYTSAMVIFFGSPIALQSGWALLPAVALSAAIVVRLLDEERYLKTHLDGYRAYCDNVRWRLVPHVW